MKVETLSKDKFTPIELKITIESEEELCSLLHRVNCAENFVLKGSDSLWLKSSVIKSDFGIYNELVMHAKRLDLIKE